MEQHILSEGVCLNGGRYEIGRMLGQGGFGITYLAQDKQFACPVAIKELYWKEHCQRDTTCSGRVKVIREADEPAFLMRKERFLREARTIFGLTAVPGVVRVSGYFEENDTAYIVMEYVKGQTLSAWLRANKVMPARDMMKHMLPIVRGLEKIHRLGILHLDISPENIMVREDGSFVLIDFGAARELSGRENRVRESKSCYSPPEQRRGACVGPYSDVYALCATMYHCVVGHAPDDCTLRERNDLLKKPSAQKIKIKRRCEALIMRGLNLDIEKRHAGMGEVAAEIEKAKAGIEKKAAYAFAAGLCSLLIVIALLYREYDREHPFRHVITETFCLTAPHDMTASEFAYAQAELEKKLDAFAGKGNYRVRVEGEQLQVQMPLDVFNGQEISGIISSQFTGFVEGKRFGFEYQSHVNWEDPKTSLIAGENQVRAAEMMGETAVFGYQCYKIWGELTRGERAHIIVDMKTRLDALGVPYAFGTLYGDENMLAFRINPGRMNRFILNTLGQNYLHIAAGEKTELVSDLYGLQIVTLPDGALGLSYVPTGSYGKEEMIALAAHAEKIGAPLYLQDGEGYAIAQAMPGDVAEDGSVVFDEFRLEGVAGMDEQNRYLLDYISVMINETSIPETCIYTGSELLDAQGNTVFGENAESRMGPSILRKEGENVLIDLLDRVEEETGYRTAAGSSSYWIELNLDVDEHMMEDLGAALDTVLGRYPFDEMTYDRTLIICAIDEKDDERFRFLISSGWDEEAGTYVPQMQIAVWESKRLEPYRQAIESWWETVDLQSYGLKRYTW